MFDTTTKKILICGGAGFIGSNFVRHLHRMYPNYRLFNLDVLTYSGNKENLIDIEAQEAHRPEAERRYIFIQGDICNRDLLARLFQAHRFDVVVNFAAETHVDRSIYASYDFVRTNVMGVHALIDTIRQYPVGRFIQISTDEVYGDVAEGFSSEEAALNPSNPYSASKAGADVLIKSYMRTHDLPAIIIRGSNNVGPYQYPEKLIPLTISNLLEGHTVPVHGTGEHVRSWLYVKDFCRAVDAVMQQGELKHIYNASGEPQTNLAVIEQVHAALALAGNFRDHIEHTADRPGADRRYAPQSHKLRSLLDWRPLHTFESMIHETVHWYLGHTDWWKAIRQQAVFQEHYARQQQAKYF